MIETPFFPIPAGLRPALRKLHTLPQEQRLDIIGKCVRKVRYKEKSEADFRAARAAEVHPEKLDSYHCSFCQGYHVYSVDKMAKKQAAMTAGA